MLTIKNPGTNSQTYDFPRRVSVRQSGETMNRVSAMLGLDMARILPADCCEDCGEQISSMRQIQHPGVDTCDRCSGGTPLPARSHNR